MNEFNSQTMEIETAIEAETVRQLSVQTARMKLERLERERKRERKDDIERKRLAYLAARAKAIEALAQVEADRGIPAKLKKVMAELGQDVLSHKSSRRAAEIKLEHFQNFLNEL